MPSLLPVFISPMSPPFVSAKSSDAKTKVYIPPSDVIASSLFFNVHCFSGGWEKEIGRDASMVYKQLKKGRKVGWRDVSECVMECLHKCVSKK
ncbi:hypothetical protein ADUPG1_013816 [Aduncisulcus paluster]|uniref:Uncharacterized protein n=1 Tax=Aduncisulcus paluster TaxID=2918883 RepID=A0ABQ5K4B5_9EUKA|nr:hypothetical protein ADUPG1_013816 [Aduncisulcus paluster]